MSPFRVPPVGGTQIGENGIECKRTQPSGSDGASEGGQKEFRQAVLDGVRERYADFGPTLAAEHLASDDGLRIPAESLRRWMREAGLWRRRRKRKPYRQRRERKAHFGELVQLDGSFHRWLEERADEACLMHMIDDATNTVYAQFSAQETIWAAVHLVRGWIERHGIPRALYTDWKNVYVRVATTREQRVGTVPLTQFGRMCQKLGIRIIAASSPQAKGRVERMHGTHQDRLIKKLRLGGIASYEEANRFLKEHYLAEHNRRFRRPAAEPADYHRRRPTARQLDEVFWLEEERVVSADWVVRYNNCLLQLERQSQHWAPAKSRVQVRENEAGEIAIHYRGQPLIFREFSRVSKAISEERGAAPSSAPPSPSPPRWHSYTPPPEHPWRRGYGNMKTPPHSAAW
jgi:hypothetical protein